MEPVSVAVPVSVTFTYRAQVAEAVSVAELGAIDFIDSSTIIE